METLKFQVTNNTIRVTQRPHIITSGMIGLPLEFSFDASWDGLDKLTVFRAGEVSITVKDPKVVPWEVLVTPNVWLKVGVYGVNAEGTIVIPTVWASVRMIIQGVDPEGDPALEPTNPIWQQTMAQVANMESQLQEHINSIAPDTIIECGPFYNDNPTNYIGYWFERRLDGTFTMKIMFFCDCDVYWLSSGQPYPVCFLDKLPFCIFGVDNVVLDLDDSYPIDADNKKYFVGDLIQEDRPGTGLEYEIPGVSDNASLYVTLTEPSIFDNLPEYVTTVYVSGYATITGRWRE